MPRAKKDQLTAAQREHVEMVHESLVNLGYPEHEAMRRAMLTVSDVPSRRHAPNVKNARVGAAKPRARAKPTPRSEATKRRERKAATGKRVPVRNRPVGRT
jgi:hypothetical protein